MNATKEISRLEAALARARGERGHGATLRARGSVHSGTPPEQYVTLVLLQRERERPGTRRYHPHPQYWMSRVC